MYGEELDQAALCNDTNKVIRLVTEENVNSQDKSGGTAFCWFAVRGNLEMATLLLKKGANPLIKNDSGISPFQFAAGNNHVEFINFIIRILKLNPFEPGGFERTPKETAFSSQQLWRTARDYTEMIAMLEAYEAEFEARYGREAGLGVENYQDYLLAIGEDYNEIMREVERFDEDRRRREAEVQRRLRTKFTPLYVGDQVTRGPDWSKGHENGGHDQGKVIEVNGDRVRVKWSLFNRKWYEYSQTTKEVVPPNYQDLVRIIRREVNEEF